MASYAEIANPALFIDMSHVFHKTSGIESKSGDPVCVFKCVCLRRGFQNKPVSSRPSHNCRAQDSRRVSIPVTARTDRSVPGMTPA